MARYLFVTGKLAAQALNDCIKSLPDLTCEAAVLPISVAALMDTRYIARHLPQSVQCDTVMIPGKCEGDLAVIEDKLGTEVIRGPEDLKDLPAFLGSKRRLEGYGEHHVKILAEIVDAHRMSLDAILARATYFRSSGADIIDLGCPVNGAFPGIENAVTLLKDQGFAVSVDSFNPEDILKADRAGVDMVLSIDSRNIEVARRLRSKVVVIPDSDRADSLDRNIAELESGHVQYIIDPILKPIGFGFAESIGTFINVRRKYPDCEMLLGLGNITELTDADTTGMNALMAGIFTELGIQYVLTTEVISWARGSVKELDSARKLMHYAQKNGVLPKHLNNDLITVKDPPFEMFSEEELRKMHVGVRDHHFRIFTDREYVYVFNNTIFVKGTDIQAIFDQLEIKDPSHAFYMGRELYKAHLALMLGKKYVQEEDLRWGYLSRQENLC